MLKSLCAALLIAAVIPSQAMEQSYAWSYLPLSYHFYGTFVADDTNGDGTLTKSELRSFNFEGQDYLQCADTRRFTSCVLYDFSYTEGQLLNFSLNNIKGRETFYVHAPDQWVYNAWIQNDEGHWIEIGHLGHFGENPMFTITPTAVLAPVPEPQTYLMFGVGLLAMLGMARRRTRS